MRDKMQRHTDITGRKFGRLLVLGRAPKPEDIRTRRAYWLCQCDCGADKVASAESMLNGDTQSCGCYKRECDAQLRTHGQTRSREYISWKGAKERCFNPRCKDFKRYGGRGITMCEEWKNSFEAFYRDMGQRPIGKSIERIDNDGPYCKENCQWATTKEQGANKRLPELTASTGKRGRFAKDMVGEVFGRLTVLARAPSRRRLGKINAEWLCQCTCGKTAVVLGSVLRRGDTKSCGCYRIECSIKNLNKLKRDP